MAKKFSKFPNIRILQKRTYIWIENLYLWHCWVSVVLSQPSAWPFGSLSSCLSFFLRLSPWLFRVAVALGEGYVLV